MSIDPLKIDAVKVLRPDQPEPPLQSPPLPPAGDSGSSPAAQVLLTEKRARGYTDFLGKKEAYRDAATEIREKDQALEKLGQKIGSLKEPLQAIVKQYPPYGHEDQERVKFLKQYAGLRKEIDALTIPRPAPDFPAPLPPSVSDSQIDDHIEDLDAAAAAYRKIRGATASGASLAAESRAAGVVYSAAPGGVSGLSPAARDESAAVQKSLEVGQHFAIDMAQGVSPSDSHFLKSLG